MECTKLMRKVFLCLLFVVFLKPKDVHSFLSSLSYNLQYSYNCETMNYQFCKKKSGRQIITTLMIGVGTKNYAENNNYQVYEYEKTKKSVSPLLHQSSGVMYKTSTFSKEEYGTIQTELSSMVRRLNDETTSSVAYKRLGAIISHDSPTVNILKNGSLCKLVNKVAGGNDEYELSTDVPVEIRSYEKIGAGMAWHIDDVLYTPPQIEVVWTLENDSDCVTMWEEKENVRSIETERNSALLLLAGGAPHCVTNLKRGKRTILKCAYKAKNAIFHEDNYVKQFGSSKIGSKKNKIKQRGKKKATRRGKR